MISLQKPPCIKGQPKVSEAAEKKDGDDGIEARQRRRIEKVGKMVVDETSAGGKRVLPSTREGEVSGAPARIPSRLGEPGSLFSRYKFLQLRLVVVMLLTRTRRELLKRRTIGAHIYLTASLSRASRAIPFVIAANPHHIDSRRVVIIALLFVGFVY